MRDITSLEKIFNAYAGKEIKDPKRFTTDIDPVVHTLAAEVDQTGFRFYHLSEKGTPIIGCMAPDDLVTAEYEKDAKGKFHLTGGFRLG